MDTKMKRALDKLLTEYESSRGQINSDPFSWAGAIRYIASRWTGQPLTHEDVRLIITNHIISRRNRSHPYVQQMQLNSPLHRPNPTLAERINANRTIHVLNENLGIPRQDLPFSDVGIDYPRSEFRLPVFAIPAPALPEGARSPKGGYVPHQLCTLCTDEITPEEAQNPGIAFCSDCTARTHLSCYNHMTPEQRELFFLRKKPSDPLVCPYCKKISPQWYAYQFSPDEVAPPAPTSTAPTSTAPTSTAPTSATPALEERRELMSRIVNRRLGVRHVLSNLGFEAPLSSDQMAQAFNVYASQYPQDKDITQEDFKNIVTTMTGGKIKHIKNFYIYKKRATSRKRATHQ